MKPRAGIGIVAAGWLAAGCHQDAASPSAPAVAQAATQAQDELWALAPAGAIGGAVISPRGIEMLEHGWLAIRGLLAVAPELAAYRAKLTEATIAALGKPEPTLADLGLSHDRGAALFFLPDNKAVAVLPVVDRDRFIAAVHGTHAGELDHFGDQTCRTIARRYVCAKEPAVLATLGHAGLDAARRQAALRGDLEILAVGTPAVAIAAQLERGALTVRGRVAGAAPELAEALSAGSPARSAHGAATGFGVIDVQPMLAKLPDSVSASRLGGIDVRRLVTGPISYEIARGTADLDLQIPIGDPTSARALVELCNNPALVAATHARLDHGVCIVPVPLIDLTLVAMVEGNVLKLGTRGPGVPPVGTPTALARELADQPWAIMFYGHGSALGIPLPPNLPIPGDRDILIGLRAMTLLNELGFGIRREGEAVRFVFGARTLWANPDDVLGKLLAIDPHEILTGKATEHARAIAAAAPASPFASDFGAGMGGALSLVPIGVVVGAAGQAADAMKRTKKSEAALELDQIGQRAQRYYSEHATFPVGVAPASPSAASCCAGPRAHCAVNLAAWKHPVWEALGLEIDQPTLFRYGYASTDGKTFVATATGDLDCDGTEIVYTLTGTLDHGTPRVTLTEPAPNSD